MGEPVPFRISKCWPRWGLDMRASKEAGEEAGKTDDGG